jgi:hypothetical protein
MNCVKRTAKNEQEDAGARCKVAGLVADTKMVAQTI